jgi:hypothetical protein
VIWDLFREDKCVPINAVCVVPLRDLYIWYFGSLFKRPGGRPGESEGGEHLR